MSSSMRARSTLFVAGLFGVANAQAHHSFVTHYITNESFQISGTITDVQLRNPHSFYYLDADTGNGQVERWEIEAQSLALLRRMGVDGNTVTPGQKVTVVGMRSRNSNLKVMFANEFVLESGKRYVMNRAQDDSAPQPAGIPLPKEGRFVATQAAAPLSKRLAGVWRWRPAGADDVLNRGGPSPMPLNAAGMAARAAYDPLNTPAMNCVPPNLPALLDAPYLTRISVSGDEVLFEHEYYKVKRKVSLTQSVSATAPAAEFGRPVGKFSADAFVIESEGYVQNPAGLASDWDANGRGADIPSSTRKRLREEYTVSGDSRYLLVNVTVEDPVYLSEPYHVTRAWERVAEGVAFEPFACDPEAAKRSSKNAVR